MFCDQQTIKHAKKRTIIKRYLSKNNIQYDVNDSTFTLVALARYVSFRAHKVLTATGTITGSLTGQIGVINAERIIEIAQNHHYLKQLIAMKQMWGQNATLNFVDHGKCNTIADLIKAEACPPNLAYLDKYLHLIANRMDLR